MLEDIYMATKDSNKQSAENSFTLLVSNVRMDNDSS